ncbi:MAG: sulfotransferase, partial [Bacteroidota bacterium]
KEIENKYLFILSPPYSGSTLLHQIISTSRNVSSNNTIEKTREGQKLKEVRQIMFDDKLKRWNPDIEMPWRLIKNEWYKYWDTSKTILLEKSPPNLIRAFKIENEFVPCYFVSLMRNPYAIAEGWHRRHSETGDRERFISNLINWFKYQEKNLQGLNNILYVRYEHLVMNPQDVKQELINFLPELEDIDVDKKFTSHNTRNISIPITNLNAEKIARLDPLFIKYITSKLKPIESTIKYLGYELL